MNRLSREISPYLLQHASNPVDWYPWSPEAFTQARKGDRPVFLSIGYSSCHWCHVMERECFADDEVAALMNETFVSIKVDREEMPHIDSIYLRVCQMMNGSAGWPLSIIMTPDKEPFFAATYLPKHSRRGSIGMVELTTLVRDAWTEKRSDIFGTAREISQLLKEASRQQPAATGEPSEDLLKKAFSHFSKSYDPAHGGFGTAPKFPQPHTFMFLLRYWKRTGDSRALSMVEETLSAMRRGGIYDQVGSGFHRYSTDRMWLVPHFEKMLYDQALLCMAYTEAYQAVPNETFRETVEDTIGYVLRDMRSEEGAFFTSEDADSAGEEGKFYLWRLDEIAALLPENDRDLAKTLFSIREEGNFREGMRGGFNIPYLDHDLDLYAREHSMNREDLVQRIRGIRQVLFAHRARRTPPFKDDKILTDWNGLMIAALAKAFQAFGNPEHLSAAITAASFILSHQVSPDGRLMHLYREGISSRPGFLDDYAFLAWGLIDLYEASFNPSFLEKASGLTKTTIEHFWDTDQGGFFLSPDDAEMELLRPKEIHDGAVPSGNSVALMNIVRLAGMTGDEELSGIARTLITASHAAISSAPSTQAFLLSALAFHLGPIHEIVIAGKRSDPEVCSMLRVVHERFLPNKVLAVFDDEQPPHDILSFLTRNRSSSGGRAMASVCRDSVCSLPAAETATLVDLLS